MPRIRWGFDVKRTNQKRHKTLHRRKTASADCDLGELDDGIRDAVLLLWQGGFQTFTSCEGGKGHSFRSGTVGLQLSGDYFDFQRRFVEFLRSHGRQNFTVSLVTDYHEGCPEGESVVYVQGLDLLSDGKKKMAIESIKRKEQRLRRRLRERAVATSREGEQTNH